MPRQSKDGSFASDKPRRDFSKLTGAPGAVQDGSFSWGLVDPALWQKCVDLVTSAGDGISFANWARNRGGTITLLAGRDTPKLRAETVEQAEMLLEEIITLYTTG